MDLFFHGRPARINFLAEVIEGLLILAGLLMGIWALARRGKGERLGERFGGRAGCVWVAALRWSHCHDICPGHRYAF